MRRHNPLFLPLWIAAAAAAVGIAAQVAHVRIRAERTRQRAEAMTGGDVARGAIAFASHGCGGCHSVTGLPQASGKVGPPLDGIAGRAVIGGRLGNRPDNMMRWIRSPQSVSPGTAMPDLGVDERDARDISALLYTRT